MRIRVKVFPKSSHEKLVREGDLIKAYIKAAPVRGRANESLVKLIAKEYNVKKSSVTIVRGLASRNKIVDISGAGRR